ncbi:MAG: gamma-glutamylcyclotransferase [Pseudomonadota bacterium]
MTSAETHLAVYGSLAPGEKNAHVLADIPGVWCDGDVYGRLEKIGWGASAGYPGLILDRSAARVAVKLLASKELPLQWARLDAFEGGDYKRVATPVITSTGVIEAYIYVVEQGGS